MKEFIAHPNHPWADELGVTTQLNLPLTPTHLRIPKCLSIQDTPAEVLRRYDVYFKGKKQSLCTVADVEQGYIERFKLGVGNMPVRDRDGQLRTVKLFGKVEIVPKGVVPSVDAD